MVPAPEHHDDVVLRWVHAAGNPYFDWLFGSASDALAALRQWLRRPESEVALRRVRLLAQPPGSGAGYIALTAAELTAARRADALAFAAGAPADLRRRRLEQLRASEGLFTAPADDELYLSKLGVPPSVRGRGLGRATLAAFAAEAAGRGFRRLRLDVSAGNDAAIGLYRSAGFAVADGGRVVAPGLAYLSMVRDTDVARVPSRPR